MFHFVQQVHQFDLFYQLFKCILFDLNKIIIILNYFFRTKLTDYGILMKLDLKETNSQQQLDFLDIRL